MRNESGRSMVEMLGVLAIIGVLSVGGIAGYTYAMRKYKANELIAAAAQCGILARSANAGEGINGTTHCGGATEAGEGVLAMDGLKVSYSSTDAEKMDVSFNKTTLEVSVEIQAKTKELCEAIENAVKVKSGSEYTDCDSNSHKVTLSWE